MVWTVIITAATALLLPVSTGTAAAGQPAAKKRILVVSSYHADYTWSQDTNRGFCAAMLAFGYFDSEAQSAEFTKNDFVETSMVLAKKVWMDAKRKGTRADLEAASARIAGIAKAFHPDLVFLGDDEAGEYIGKRYLDTGTPVVFWGFNDNPVKYGLVDTAARPGHNVTGVYQSGYYLETLGLLKTVAPAVRTLAVLSDETTSGRTHSKALEYLSRKGELPLKLIDVVSTSDYELWKTRALELQKKVDAFYVVSMIGLKNKAGKAVPIKEVEAWYLANSAIPEASRGHYVKDGLLCAADDSGYKQAYEAVTMAHDILAKGMKPSMYPVRTPKRGALMVNWDRAAALGIVLTPSMGIEEFIKSPAQ